MAAEGSLADLKFKDADGAGLERAFKPLQDANVVAFRVDRDEVHVPEPLLRRVVVERDGGEVLEAGGDDRARRRVPVLLVPQAFIASHWPCARVLPHHPAAHGLALVAQRQGRRYGYPAGLVARRRAHERGPDPKVREGPAQPAHVVQSNLEDVEVEVRRGRQVGLHLVRAGGPAVAAARWPTHRFVSILVAVSLLACVTVQVS